MVPSSRQSILALCLLVCLGSHAAGYAAGSAPGMTSVDDIIELETKPAPKVNLSQPVQAVDSPLQAHIEKSTEFLSAEDRQNLARLWQTVIKRNPVIQYGLKQLATPPELRYAHASIMSRTVGGLLTGASMLPYMMGADQYTAGATTLSANLVDRAMTESQKIDPKLLPSDTELVELSGMVQSLQQALMEHYFGYKTSLNRIAQLQQQAAELQAQYQKAQQQSDINHALWSRYHYEDTNTQMLASRLEAKRHYMALERLVGTDGIRSLRFGDSQVPADSGKITEMSKSSQTQTRVKL